MALTSSFPHWENLPDACKCLPQWVLWKKVERDGRITKIPIDRYGANASSTAPHTWSHLDEAKEAFKKGIGAGPGFVFTRASKITGIDFDHCLDPATGQIDPWAKAYLDRLQSYSDISPSGEGIHCIIKGSLPEGTDGKKKILKGDGYRPKAAIEIYSAGRFFTMTGCRLQEYPPTVEDRQEELTAIFNELFKAEVDPVREETQAKDEPVRTSAKEKSSQPVDGPGLSDEVLIARMLSSTNADEIEALFIRGDTAAYGGDDSAADLAFCNHLAFWTGKNRQQMDRLFRQSKLMRPKWDEKRGNQTYGEKTIDEAIRGTNEVYDPSPDPQPVDGLDLQDVKLYKDCKLLGYGVDIDGIIYNKAIDKKGKSIKARICDGFARISAETRRENGDAIFTITGRGSEDGYTFTFDMLAEDFADPRKLTGKLTAQFGACNVVGGLTGPIIQRISKNIKKLKLVTSPQWIEENVAVPGLDLVPNLKFNLHPRVPVDVSGNSLEDARACLKNLIEAWSPQDTTIVLTTILGAPVVARWFPDDRFGLALRGMTGSGKTEAIKNLMSIYGRGYLSEANILKWGEGGTVNALLKTAALAGFMPWLVDNYKPIKQGSSQALISMVHAVLEGGEKLRLNRNADFREAQGFSCTPIITGEDFPEEASSLARVLVVDWSPIQDVNKLTNAQILSENLPAIGKAWLTWLSLHSEEVDEAKKTFARDRAECVAALAEGGCVNAGRTGTAIAILKFVWSIASKCPELAEVLSSYKENFEEGIYKLEGRVSQETSEAVEAEKFVESLQEIISSGRGRITRKWEVGKSDTCTNAIGWQEEDGSVCIYPRMAKDIIRRMNNYEGQDLSGKVLYRQLFERGHIYRENDRYTLPRWVNGHTVRVLVFKPDVLFEMNHEKAEGDQIDLTSVSIAEERKLAEKRLLEREEHFRQASKVRS